MGSVKKYKQKGVSIDFCMNESEPLKEEDVKAIAAFIAKIAYNKLTEAQKSAESLCRKVLIEDRK